ncbi:hypothetical protein BESB_061100 [Besnoitia besnoiti]|uniref:Uncharacterized protein n=1 Tax=Besnoitia besnoiti TaxID=94643 RepID=A0A2A9MHV2_BESBE|nr:hypothetical protein BESB_061100 [Besnoitia besnoiti]PFH35223.1 hypothetical protein BESB_061100 [Besnoitia besnoiti]
MEFLVGDDTGLLKNVSTRTRCTYTYKTCQQDRNEAILAACWSSPQLVSDEVTIGRRSGVVEAVALPPPPAASSALTAKMSIPCGANPVRAPHYAPRALSCSVQPLRSIRMPAPCVQTSLLHTPEVRSILNASLRESLAADPYFSLFHSPASSPLVPAESPFFGSALPQLFCLDQEGHACVVNWDGDFAEELQVLATAADEKVDFDESEGTLRLKKTREDVSPESADHTGALSRVSVYEISFPSVPAYSHPSPVSVSGSLRRVSSQPRAGPRVKQEEGASATSAASSSCHVVAGWQLAGPVGCATPIHPLMPDRFAFGGRENEVKVFDLARGRYVWAAKNVKQTLLQLRVAVNPTSLAWLPRVHPLVLAAGTARGAVRLFDLRCQRRPVYEVENACRGTHETVEKRVITAMAAEEVRRCGAGGLWDILQAVETARAQLSDAGEDRRPAAPAASEAASTRVKVKQEPEEGEKASELSLAKGARGKGAKKRTRTAQSETQEGARDKKRAQLKAEGLGAEEERQSAQSAAETAEESEVSDEALKAQLRSLYGRDRTKLYFADSCGAVYVHSVLTEDALMRQIDKNVQKHNRTSCCATLSEDEEAERWSSGAAAAPAQKESKWADPRIRHKLILAFQEKAQGKLSSKKKRLQAVHVPAQRAAVRHALHRRIQRHHGRRRRSRCLITCCPFFSALTEDVSGRLLVGVGYGRHAYVWQTASRKLVDKVYLKQKLLAVLPGRNFLRAEEEGGSNSKCSDEEASDGESADTDEEENEKDAKSEEGEGDFVDGENSEDDGDSEDEEGSEGEGDLEGEGDSDDEEGSEGEGDSKGEADSDGEDDDSEGEEEDSEEDDASDASLEDVSRRGKGRGASRGGERKEGRQKRSRQFGVGGMGAKGRRVSRA